MLHFRSLQHKIGPITFTLFLFIFVLSFVSTAYGANAAASNANGIFLVQSTPSPVVSSACPSGAPVTTPPEATIVWPMNSASTIKAHVGDVVEFRLSSANQWNGPTTSQGVLELLGPAGYYSQANSACIWDFQVMSTGTTTLTFTGKPLCPPLSLCPLYTIIQNATVKVK